MSSEKIYKFEPHRTISLGGFDRRGCSAAISAASATGMKISGVWADSADFVTVNLFNADDNFGQNYSTRYLPNTDLTGITCSFQLNITNGFYPGSSKFQSIPWGMLSWTAPDGSSGTTALPLFTNGSFATPNPVGTRATSVFAVGGTIDTGDRFQVIYSGNYVADVTMTVGGGGAITVLMTALCAQINAFHASLGTAVYPLTAAITGAAEFTVTCQQPGTDGNTIELWTQIDVAGTATLTPIGATKMSSGADPTSFFVRLDFSAMRLTSILRCWLTLAPPLPIDTGAGDSTLEPFTQGDFSYVFSNWVVGSKLVNKDLQIAGPGSVVVGSMDGGAKFYGGWSLTPGAYFHGFGRTSTLPDDRVVVTYNCQSTHNLYIATLTGPGQGKLLIAVGSSTLITIDCSVGAGSARRLVATALPAGKHVISVGVSGSCVFDCIQAAVLSDINPPLATYTELNEACDYDTLAGLISPERLLWQLQKRGFTGDLDFYAGVLLGQFKRIRHGGYFPSVTVTITGTPNTGTGTGDGSAVFVSLGLGTGITTIGAAAFPMDDLTSLAQRLVNGINGTFVGVIAAPTMTAGQFTVTVISPINGFPISVKTGNITGLSIALTGDNDGMLGPGNEGTWAIDAAQPSPLTVSFADYMADLSTLMSGSGQTMTVAFSQELLGPPDLNTAMGAWTQRYGNNRTVVTATTFGSWGAGTVKSVSAGIIEQTGHGYLDSYQVNFTNPSTGEKGSWRVLLVDANHYSLDEPVNGAAYTPESGDLAVASLITAQCAFNPLTVTPYLSACYVQMANIMAAAGLVPWLQFGEILHWFFSYTESLPIASFYNYGGDVGISTATPHYLGAGETLILAGTGFIDGTQFIGTVIDAYNFTVPVTWPGATPAAAGTVTGGGMGFYDANQQAAAVIALGTPLALFFTQDDSISGVGPDVAFLQSRIFDHISTIISDVLGAQGSSQFELLYPTDVTAPTCYYSVDRPYPQGGRLNYVVSLPTQFETKAGSGLDRWKTEALSWQSFYFNFDNFITMIAYPISVLSWAAADVVILIGWNYGGAPWTQAYLYAKNQSVTAINMWAVDHDAEYSWPALMPGNQPTTQN